VTGGFAFNPTRWRAFADAVAFALGVNVWISVILLPGLFVGTWRTPGALLLGFAPLAVLLVGLARRSDSVLLFAFPAAVLAPTAVYPDLIASYVYGPVRFALVSASVIGYLFGASYLSSWYEPVEPVSTRPLASASEPVPARWRRRFRVYAGLALLSVAVPVALLWQVNFATEGQAFLRELYLGRVASFTALLNLAALALWVLLYWSVFMGTLRPHRTGDRDLVFALSALRSESRRGRPRPVFYVGVVAALVFMLLLLATR